MSPSQVIGRQDKQTLRRFMSVLVHTGITCEGYIFNGLFSCVVPFVWYEETSLSFVLFSLLLVSF